MVLFPYLFYGPLLATWHLEIIWTSASKNRLFTLYIYNYLVIMIAFTDCFIVINELKHGKCLAWCYSFSSACKDEEDCQYYYHSAQSPSLSTSFWWSYLQLSLLQLSGGFLNLCHLPGHCSWVPLFYFQFLLQIPT